MTGDNNVILTFSEHNRDLLVWGVVDDQGQVRAYRDTEAAGTAADAAGPITVTVEVLGSAPRTFDCNRLVYHHTDLGWCFAAIGHPITIANTADDT